MYVAYSYAIFQYKLTKLLLTIIYSTEYVIEAFVVNKQKINDKN